MWLKPAILVVFLALLVSLGSGLYYLMKDKGTTRRTLHSLGVRVTLAALLIGLIIYGLQTGQLKSQAPWDAELQRLEQNEKQGQ